MAEQSKPRPVVIVSRCLLGERVRYDGDHNRHVFVVERLARVAELIAICPEEEAGFGVPRPTIRLVRHDDQVRVLVSQTGADVTPTLQSWLEPRIDELRGLRIAAAILKARSPSCGTGSTPLYDDGGSVIGSTSGVFSAALASALPGVPIFEDSDLLDVSRQRELLDAIGVDE